MNNHYAVLGVLPSASAEEIRASYRQLVKRFHPDMPGGNAGFFARIREAYEELCEPDRRKAYDEQWRQRTLRARSAARTRKQAAQPPPGPTARPTSDNGKAEGSAPGARDPRQPLPMLTRIMSIAVPRSGRFQLQGLIGDIHVVPTTPDTLWETTLRKYADSDPEHLARHVIQIKLSGERDLVKTMMPRPTDFGVEFQKGSEEEQKTRLRRFFENLVGKGPFGGLFTTRPFGLYGTFLPLTLHVSVPRGTHLFLRDVTGAITVGDVEGEVTAKLLGGVMRTGRIRRARVTLNGGSRAFLADVDGAVDVMGFGTSRTYIGGRIPQMRVVLDNQAQAEVSGRVTDLLSEVNGQARLEVNKPVYEAHCDVRDEGYVKLARVLGRLAGTRAPGARVDAVLQGNQMPIAG